MPRAGPRKTSIVGRMTRLILGIIVLQTLLFSGILMVGGVIDQAVKNAYQSFHDKVGNRRDYVQNEMKNKWTNLEPYLANIRKLLSTSGTDAKSFFGAAAKQLVPLLRASQATGVFIVLDPDFDGGHDFPALYLRDYDPLMNPYGNDDIYMVYGPPELAESLMIPMDQTWRYRFRPSDANSAFIRKPYGTASVAVKAALFGYWSKPFRLSEGDVTIVTYSMPLFDDSGALRGVIGTEMTLNHLAKFFPAQELQPKDSLGYLVAFSDDDGGTLTPLIMGGPLQKRLIKADEALRLSPADENRQIYELLNRNGAEKLYAAVAKMGLYKFNTPFESEQWYMVGIMRESDLLRYADRIRRILWLSLLASIVIGTVGGILISLQMTKPIVALARLVKDRDQRSELHLPPTGLAEIDELSRSVEQANRRILESALRLTKIVEVLGLPIGAFEVNLALDRVFVTDNFWAIVGLGTAAEGWDDGATFLALLEGAFCAPEVGELDVFRIEADGGRWIRYKTSRNAESIVGVVMDVTGEMREKKEMQRERDHDPLTLLLNRKGFQWEFERWRESAAGATAAALVMFDLDNLKLVNDSYGHKWGDQYIVAAVERLKEVAPEANGLLGRRSGDEFVLLLHGFPDKAGIRRCMDTFYEGLGKKVLDFPDGKRMPVSISAGIMWIDSDEFSYDELLHFADEALYVAKGNKKGTYVESTITDGAKSPRG